MESFEDFVAAQGPALTRYAFLLSGDGPGAEDLTQSSLLKAYRRWPQVSVLEDPVAYVRRIITREFLSMRRKRSASEVIVAAPEVADRESVPDHAAQVADAFVLWELLGALPKKQRAVLVMRYYLDFSFEEIARVLGCTSGTARSHASRGLATIRVTESLQQEGSFR